MTDIEQKTLVERLRIIPDQNGLMYEDYEDVMQAADLIEQHEAFRQEVSDVVEQALSFGDVESLRRKGVLSRFIIPKPKPDPLVDVAKMMGYFNTTAEHWVEAVRAALDALGFEIREKNNDR